jgi:ADP-heptose:LPS heptosyltransferase
MSDLRKGGKDDVFLCGQIARKCRKEVISLAGKTSIRQMIALLERASVVLCHDSAPMHAAAALGRPLVCLTGPTNPARTGPYRRMGDVLRVPLPCSPCYLRKLSQCGYAHRCMHDLRVEDVVARIRTLLPRVAATSQGVAVAPRPTLR